MNNFIYLPTREECQKAVKNSEAFYCNKTNINGFNVELYDYRLAGLRDFIEHKAFELRGLCFINNNGTWDRHILMNKFFNLNETEIENTKSWMLKDIKDKKIVRVQEKEDGSVISFITFPDGTIRAKSKMSFASDQAIMAQEVYDSSEEIQEFIRYCQLNDLTAIWELVSFKNQIVLNYNKTELRLLQLRNSKTGEYLKYSDYQEQAKNIITAHEYSTEVSLDELLHKQETEENKEGWVITLEDGQMLKVKTSWYFQIHRLISDNAIAENVLIETILEDRIDDVLSQIQPGEKRDFIENITDTIRTDFNHKVQEFKKLRGSYYNKYNENRKEFASKHKDNDVFHAVMRSLNTSFRDIEETAKNEIKKDILKRSYRLKDAKEYVQNIGNNNENHY